MVIMSAPARAIGPAATRGSSRSSRSRIGSVIPKTADPVTPPATPPRIRKLLRRCLEPDRKQRLQAIGEARIAIDAPEQDLRPLPGGVRVWPWALTSVVTIVALVLAYAYFRRTPEETRVFKLSVLLAEN